ncbi:sigma factor-like helix-turn-helix DNA-binding protein [Actinomycetospora chibensis]|uniref:Sigma factor-like helix-turn-helix DNA-binding protein n=2 Tax=Actinomycetospora chibensis TaxID=663606 RepID=A0ABV9RAP9_9PSEU|nr:hypothetical protein [Actinomycetospora chibensis]
MAALDALPAVQRRALLLRHARGMTPTEIAALDGVAVDVVERRLAHGALALAHRLGVPGTPDVVAARELAPLGGFADASLAPTASGVDGAEGRRRRLPIVAASLAAASMTALGAAVATSQGLDQVGDTAGPGSPIGIGSAPGLGAMLPPPAAGTEAGAVLPGPADTAVDDLGLRPEPSSGPVPSLAASPGPLAGVPAVGTGPVDAGAPRAAVGPGVPTSRPSPSSSPAPSSAVSESSPAPSSSGSQPSGSASPSTSATGPGPTTRPEPRERRDDPPPRAGASSGGSGDDRKGGRDGGRDGGGDAPRGGERESDRGGGARGGDDSGGGDGRGGDGRDGASPSGSGSSRGGR